MNHSFNKLIEKIRLWWSSPEDDDGNPNDVIPYFWERSIGDHYFGQFSMAVLKGKNEIEDQSQVDVEAGRVFFGVYDGHGGPRASTYAVENLYNNFKNAERFCKSFHLAGASQSLFRRTIDDTETGFLKIVQKEFADGNQLIATHGCSCLIGVLSSGTLQYANLGDSRAVIGCVDDSGLLVAWQITQDHNVNSEEVRREYKVSQRGNQHLLVKVNGMWHIKGIIQTTRSIGDGCLKWENLALDETHKDFHIRGRTIWPLLSSDPSVEGVILKPFHRFVIFSTKGLWEHLTNREAVELVHRGSRQGAARRLVKRALRTKAIKAGMSYERLKAVSIENRRKYIDDISVIVLFFDHLPKDVKKITRELSVKGFADEAGPSSSNKEGN